MMNKFIRLMGLLCLLVSPAFAATYSFTPSTPFSTITSDLAVTGPNVYSFAAGTYSQITSTLTFPCNTGNTYTGPTVPFVVGQGVQPTAVLDAAFSGSNLIKILGDSTHTVPGSGCTVQYLGLENQNAIAYAPVSGLLFQYNLVYNILGTVGSGTGNTTAWAGFYMVNGTTQDIAYSTFQWNTFGPSCTDLDSLATDEGGTCGGLMIQGSNVNVTIQDNLFTNIEEGIHTLGQGTNGGIGTNLTQVNNDFTGIHRIAIENQQEVVTNQVTSHNDNHDQYRPQGFSFGISQACCQAAGGSPAGANTVQDNLMVFNSPCLITSYCVGYGIEAWGNGATYTGNVIQGNYMANGLSIGGYSGGPSINLVATNNIIQGGMSSGVTCEEGGTLPSSCNDVTTPTYTPNTTSNLISPIASGSPTISPASGTVTFPQTITLSEAAANTPIYFTTDGSVPVPGQGSLPAGGTTQLYTAPLLQQLDYHSRGRAVGHGCQSNCLPCRLWLHCQPDRAGQLFDWRVAHGGIGLPYGPGPDLGDRAD
jgi:hypothetical protein